MMFRSEHGACSSNSSNLPQSCANTPLTPLIDERPCFACEINNIRRYET